MTQPLLKFPVDAHGAPRTIDPLHTFDALVAWLRDLAAEKEAPGFIVGVSGTDSILAFLACAKAMAALGKPGRVLGVHYGAPFPPPDKTPEMIAHLLNVNPSYRWFARVVMPWLQEQAPEAELIVDSSIDYTDDYQRWASLFKKSLSGALRTEPLPAGQNYWVVGTRNATEQALGAYSNISAAASVQPLMPLWKSEIMKICTALGVPTLALEKSRQVDCDCGRFDIAADHIDEVDMVLMARTGLLGRAALERAISAPLLKKLEDFVSEQIAAAHFKKEIPYTPPPGIVISPPL